MSKKELRTYVCLHQPCSFKTDKRKAIYTHLVRTHNERKEDYECEYCSKVFERDSEVEQHLLTVHPQDAFTYTCVSRIESVINECAQLGSENKTSNPITDDSNTKPIPVKATPIEEKSFVINGTLNDNNNVRTKASVNASLNNIAKTVRNDNYKDLKDIVDETIDEEFQNGGSDENEDIDVAENDGVEEEEDGDDDEAQAYVSEPSGLKIKLSLKKNVETDPEESTKPGSSIHNTRFSANRRPSNPPSAVPNSGNAQIRDKASKYFDKLEVYHTTDSQGRRCCPFCDYKTTKNTIRVHLSGIHKVHFVKCSLCDYKAAFPHQITQHGLKFHKTTNINVIQLSKEYREKIIEQLKGKSDIKIANPTTTVAEAANSPIIEDEDFTSEESVSSSEESPEPEVTPAKSDDKVFKAPVCQTSKTDYYKIEYQKGVYLYCCKLCSFRTPVRATIYTHKYRHEEKAYQCGYCDYTGAPRSGVVHHLRAKHKSLPILVKEVDQPPILQTEHQLETKEDDVDDIMDCDPLEPPVIPDASTTVSPPQTIIKVLQFKRSMTVSPEPAEDDLKEPSEPSSDYKLSVNKLYRVNPVGLPKFVCELCDYACDTHPKMKHHLYRHRPQKYKCPYCDHQKYPRSYVVRHVRDTHRDKPNRVIDLSKSEDPVIAAKYSREVAEIEDTVEEKAQEPAHKSPSPETTAVKQEPSSSFNSSLFTDETSEDTNEEVNELKKFAQKLNLRSVLTSDLNDDLYDSSTTNPNDTPFTSTPLIESMINGQYQSNVPKLGGKNFEKKKSLKDYRVNNASGPKYICNKCGYSTDIYKTIHNHMYRHESQRFQCSYCGYRRSPRSFVENHIREVHKAPLIVIELPPGQDDDDIPTGSPKQQSVGIKRKLSQPDVSDIDPANNKIQKLEPENSHVSKLCVKLPAPKPASKVNVKTEKGLVVPKLEPIEPVDDILEQIADVKPTQPPAVVAQRAPSTKLSPPTIVNPLRYKEGNRTTYKTMYKCTFDPETCNHISKDKSKMKQHLFMHVEYRPWCCDLCEMTASQSSHIKNHLRTEHPEGPDTRFKYKRHNYLEKHIEGFLTKGLFTVPVSEYRVIMDMKGTMKNSKQVTFKRDSTGNFECPYCPYKTKGGGITDHVKMKHMQPRFKCHWCSYRAFYRSEIRKHHRKEKSHAGKEFKTQELDLVQVVEGFREKHGDAFYMPYEDDDDDDDDDDKSDVSTSDDSYIDDDIEHMNEDLNMSDKTTRTLDEAEEEFSFGANTKTFQDGSMFAVPKPVVQTVSNKCTSQTQGLGHTKSSRFKCGYCSFSAPLRVKVKMHCGKKHPYKPISVVEDDVTTMKPSLDHAIINESRLDTLSDISACDNIVNVNSAGLKGTKFEQDLRKAGVAKLNLASLFPNSKRFNKRSNGQQITQPTKLDLNDSGEFKKPNGTISQNNISKESIDHCKYTQNREIGIVKPDNNEVLDDTANSDEGIGKHMASADAINDKNNSDVNTKTKKMKIQTTFPHCTPVILEGDGENSSDSVDMMTNDIENKNSGDFKKADSDEESEHSKDYMKSDGTEIHMDIEDNHTFVNSPTDNDKANPGVGKGINDIDGKATFGKSVLSKDTGSKANRTGEFDKADSMMKGKQIIEMSSDDRCVLEDMREEH